jgi:hypothetical protein
MTVQGQTAVTFVNWRQRVGVWLGISINPASIALGAVLAARVSLSRLAVLIPLGTILLTALVLTAGVIGRRYRLPLAGLASRTFGDGAGARVLNLLMALGMLGWAGFQVGLAGSSLSGLLGWPLWLGMVLTAVAIYILGSMGVNRWNALVWVTALASLGVAIISLLVSVGEVGQSPVMAFGLGDTLWVIGAIIAYASLFSLRCADFTWDLASDRDVFIDGIAFAVPLVLSLGIGALLYQAVGSPNIGDVLAETRYAFLGLVFLIISLLSPAMSGLHSGSLAMRQVVPITRRQAMLVHCGLALLLGFARFDYLILSFLEWVGALLPSALVVILLHTAVPLPKHLCRTAWWIGAAAGVIAKLLGSQAHLAIGAAVAVIVFGAATMLIKNARMSEEIGRS